MRKVLIKSTNASAECSLALDTQGHIALRVTLGEASGTPDWTASCTVEIDAGQLPEIAAAVREVFATPEVL